MAVRMTGATGVLGTETAAELFRTTEETIYVLVRGESNEEAAHRLRTFWSDIRELYEAVGGRIVPLAGDFTKADMGIDDETKESLKGQIGRVFHIGAQTKDSLHDPRLPENLYAADSSLFPEAAGLPPILTIMALSTAVAQKARETV